MARTRAFNEEEVLQKAIHLFWEKGYHGTSMDDLVKAMGITRASLYNTFNNKRQLYERALQTYRHTNNRQVFQLLERGEPTIATLGQLFQSATEGKSTTACGQRGCFMINSTTELANLDSDIQQLAKENNQKLVAAIHRFLQRMREAGTLKSDLDPKGVAQLIFITYSGLQINRMMDICPTANGAAVQTLLDQLR